jgi:two-component system OmpR family sensor kinase
MMRYDDRLATVLRLTPVGANVARIQFRQLLDLLGIRPAEDDGEMLDQAYMRLSQLAAGLPVADRVAILREGGLRLRSARLVSVLAQVDSQTAKAAIEAAQLSSAQWCDLIPALPIAYRGLLRHRDDLGEDAHALLARLGIAEAALPSPAAASEGVAPQQEAAPEAVAPYKAGFDAVAPHKAASEKAAERQDSDDDIAAIVRRIAAFRQARHATDGEHVPLAQQTSATHVESFDFLSDAEGRIHWSEAAVAPMVVGQMMGGTGLSAAAVRLHQPLRALSVTLNGAPAISGAWQVDAVPRFDPLGGRFLGHMGRFRRPVEAGMAPLSEPHHQDSEADRLRQLLHELRTPVNAIQGFAEIIQQQLFGATPHEYRALAANIAADGAHILAGFEELDRFAKLASGAMDIANGDCDMHSVLANSVSRLQPAASGQGPRFAFQGPSGALPIAMAAIEAERLCWRILATLAGNATAQEELDVSLIGDGDQAKVIFALPQALCHLDDAALFHTAPAGTGIGASMFGTGFALRLAEVEARSGGGSLSRDGMFLLLCLPGLTQPAGQPSDGEPQAEAVAPPAA